MANIKTHSTPQPNTEVTYEGRKWLSKADWADIANALQTSCEAALADRSTLDENLKQWDDSYEMLAGARNFPWEHASNLITPMTVTQVDSLTAYLAAQVLVPGRLFLVTGNTPQAQESSAKVERYYNSQLRRQRFDTTWYDELYKWLKRSPKEGTGIIECVWKYRNAKRHATERQPIMEQTEDGQQVQSIGEDGMPMFEDVAIDLEEIYNDVWWETRSLRNFYTIPAACPSIQKAPAAVVIEYPYETDLQELVNASKEPGSLLHFDEDEVEMALLMVPNGATELASSEQPTAIYTAGRQVNLGEGQGTISPKFFRNRGPVEVHRVHSNQFDLDGDGVAEENVFWWHRSTKRLLGWMRYEYFNGLRPFFDFSLFPRDDVWYGFSLVERLAGLQQEEDALRNQRIDAGDISLGGIWAFLAGATDKNKVEFGPAGMNEIDPTVVQGDVRKAIAKIDVGEPTNWSFLETDKIKQDAQEFTGLANPAMGLQSPGRRSAAEAKQWQAAAATRTGLLAMRFRMAIRKLINFTHELTKQYLNTDQEFSINGEQFKLPLEVLRQDYNIDVSGASDPIDANTRKAETLQAVFEFMQVPLIGQNPMHQFYLLRKAIQAMGWEVEEDKIIGTEQEIQQMMQQQAQQAQAQQLLGGGQDQGQGGGEPPQPQTPLTQKPGGLA